MTEKLPEKTPDDDKSKIKFSVPDLAIGALTAVLVALLGSRLGTAGTIAGAAIGSIASALANTFLTAGFERTRTGLRLVVTRRPELDADGTDAVAEPPLPLGEVPDSVLAPNADPTAPAPTSRRRQVLGFAAASVLATAGATFAITMGIVTGAEVSTGSSLDGRPGATSVGSAVGSRSETDPTPSATPTPTASATPTATTVTPTPTASATPDPLVTAEPTPTASATPAPTPAAVTSPTAAPTPTTGG